MGQQRASNMAAAGATKAEIKAANPGLSSKQITQIVSPTPSVRDQIRAAGANGNISKNELLKIADSSGKTSSQIIHQLDAVNSRLTDKNKDIIGLGSAAANAYSRGNLGDQGNNYWLSGGNAVGRGPIETALSQMNGTTTPVRQGQGGYTTPGTGLIPRGQQVYGSYNGAPQLRIKPAIAGGFAGGTGTNTETETDSSTGSAVGTGSGTGGDATTTTLPTLPLPSEPAKPVFQSANSDNLTGNATGYRSNKSSWRRNAKSIKGTNNLKINPNFNAAGVGVNAGLKLVSGFLR